MANYPNSNFMLSFNEEISFYFAAQTSGDASVVGDYPMCMLLSPLTYESQRTCLTGTPDLNPPNVSTRAILESVDVNPLCMPRDMGHLSVPVDSRYFFPSNQDMEFPMVRMQPGLGKMQLDMIDSHSPSPSVSGIHKSQFSNLRGAPEPRDVLELRVSDRRFLDASWSIIEIMSVVRLVHNQSPSSQDTAIRKSTRLLDSYIRTLPEDVFLWIESHRERVGVVSAKTHAVTRRKRSEKKCLHICLWCKETITAKLNLANHIRSHLNLHLSFCAQCEFSSVNPSLPARHKCRK